MDKLTDFGVVFGEFVAGGWGKRLLGASFSVERAEFACAECGLWGEEHTRGECYWRNSINAGIGSWLVGRCVGSKPARARRFAASRLMRARRPAHLYLSRVESGGSMREMESASSRRGCGSCGKPACRFSKGLRETVRRFPRSRQLPQPGAPAGCVSGLPESHKEGRQAARSNRPRTVLRAPLWDLCPGCFAALDAQWRVRAIEHQYRYWQATRRADPSRLTQQKGGRDG